MEIEFTTQWYFTITTSHPGLIVFCVSGSSCVKWVLCQMLISLAYLSTCLQV